MIRCPLFVASLGNPLPAYRNTFHSAGHTLLSSLQQFLGYPPFSKDRAYANGLTSRGSSFTLWQSPTLMNVSGPAVAMAWKTFLKDVPQEERLHARLVIIHDELENSLGAIKVKQGGSARGHNGLKSVMNSLGGNAFTKIGIGIGRPESRDSRSVADYVLKKMTTAEIQKISDGVSVVETELMRMCNNAT